MSKTNNAFTQAYGVLPFGFKWLTGDMSWEDYGGAWFKAIPGTRNYFVIRYENGHEHDKELPRHMVEVKSVDVGAMGDERANQILSSCGFKIVGDEIVSDSGDVLALRSDVATWDHIIVDAALGYGACAPLDDYSGDTGMRQLVRAACRSAVAMMNDAVLLKAALDRPVNAIGSTAAEYAAGDITSALSRGPYDTSKQIMRHVHGMTPFGPSEPHEVSE